MTPPRYAADRPFPAYAFVPGRLPHPVTNPHGHSYQQPPTQCLPLDSDRPLDSSEFCFAVDLFNAGYYWEAHETWEQLWIAAKRTGIVADFLKGLIKLAAAGVKAREGQQRGVQRHTNRAAELLAGVRSTQSVEAVVFAGIHLENLIRDIRRLAQDPQIDDTPTVQGHRVIEIDLILISS